MAHEISYANGINETAYVGAVGWHGLGQELKPGATIEEWQAAAGMAWRIQRSVVRYATERGQEQGFRALDDRHVLFRSDTKAALSVVSDGFKVVQPGAVLEFFRDLTEDAGYALETAGVLFGGRRFWALARTPDAAEVGAGDSLRRYLLLSTSCDGSMATEARDTTVRVVCANTLGLAARDAAKVRVTHRSVFDPKDAKERMGLGHAAFAAQMDLFRRLADTKLADSEAVAMTAELFVPGAMRLPDDERAKALASRPVRGVLDLFGGAAKGSALDGVRGTAWGWLNAVTEHVDHAARARSADNRRASAWFGAGDALKTRALEMAEAA